MAVFIAKKLPPKKKTKSKKKAGKQLEPAKGKMPFAVLYALGEDKLDIIDGRLLKGRPALEVARLIHSWNDLKYMQEDTLRRMLDRYRKSALASFAEDAGEGQFDLTKLHENYDVVDGLLQLIAMQNRRLRAGASFEAGKVVTKTVTENMKFMLDLYRELNTVCMETGLTRRVPKSHAVGVYGSVMGGAVSSGKKDFDLSLHFYEQAREATAEILNVLQGEATLISSMPLEQGDAV